MVQEMNHSGDDNGSDDIDCSNGYGNDNDHDDD